MRRGKQGHTSLPGLPGKALACLYVLVAALPMLAVLMWKAEPAPALSELGTAFALTAAALLFLQFLSSGRYESVSGQVGIDRPDTATLRRKGGARTLGGSPSALGHEQTSRDVRVMSVIALKPDIHQRGLHVRQVPLADI